MDRHIGRLEQEQMAVAREILMPAAVLAGDRLRQIAVLGDDSDHGAARHPGPRPGMALQIAENHGEIAGHPILSANGPCPGDIERYILTRQAVPAYREAMPCPNTWSRDTCPALRPT